MIRISGDIVIAGAGPAGCTLALMLAGSGIRVILVEKDTFPRDKICGDALGGQALSVLKRMPGEVYQSFLSGVRKSPSYGIRFVSPGLYSADIPFTTGPAPEPAGYLCPRRDFDHFLARQAKRSPYIQFLEGEPAQDVQVSADKVSVQTERHEITAQVIAGADGVHSLVRKKLTGAGLPVSRTAVGIRGYYSGVTGTPPGDLIELFFLKELLPFYFWIFPEVNGLTNAGLALMRDDISSRKASLSSLMDRIIRTHPLIAPRFDPAVLQGRMEAHALPLANPPGPFSGARFLLLGDAASLVDAFTGEGIGNAMASGEVAARVLRECFQRQDFSRQALADYDRQMLRRAGRELNTSALLHRMASHPRLFDFIIRKANRNKEFRALISAAFTSENIRKKLTNPLFLARLALGRSAAKPLQKGPSL